MVRIYASPKIAAFGDHLTAMQQSLTKMKGFDWPDYTAFTSL